MFSCSSEAISSANLNSVSIWRLDLLELIFATFCCQGFMIDGFPVDLDQAETFVRDIGHPSKVVLFRANNTVLKGRLLSRWCTASIWSILVHLVAEAVLSYFHQLQLISITKCTKIWCTNLFDHLTLFDLVNTQFGALRGDQKARSIFCAAYWIC